MIILSNTKLKHLLALNEASATTNFVYTYGNESIFNVFACNYCVISLCLLLLHIIIGFFGPICSSYKPITCIFIYWYRPVYAKTYLILDLN
jgi:hypothetical protein